MSEKEYCVKLSKSEIDMLILQLGARVDDFKEMQVIAGKEGDIKRVIEIENCIVPLVSGVKKLQEVRHA